MIASVTIGSVQITVWGILAAVLALGAAVYMVFALRRHGWTGLQGILCCLGACALALLLGRGVFFALRPEFLTDPMGDYLGLAPLFNPAVGSISIAGVLPGLLLGSLGAAALFRKSAAEAWDLFAVPGLLLFAGFRFIEPLTGQGFGPFMTNPAFCFVPLAIQNGWDGWMFSVCFAEGLLLLGAAVYLGTRKLRTRRWKTLGALILLSLLQIIPESLRRDDVLKIFIFARVTQLVYCLAMVISAVVIWRRAARLGTGKGTILREAGGLLAGIALLVAGEFALDKMNWPDWAIYLAMGVVLAGMLAMLLRRLIRTDRQEA